MGFIRAAFDAINGTFADQWKDFVTAPAGVAPTVAIFPGQKQGQDAGRGSNTKGSENIITNGSKVVVPEGFALITVEDGQFTGFIAEPGGYEWRSNDQNSQSIFAGDGIVSPLIKTSWERFKFGGQPGSEQQVYYVNLKEIPNNRFGTQSEIYWDDAYLGAQVGAIARGTYTLKIVDPLLFTKQFVPLAYLQPGAQHFDFSDFDNPAASQLFNEVVGSLAAAFSHYTNDPERGNRITKLQSDSIGFAQSLSAAVEEAYQWTTDRGLTIVKTALAAIEYDEDTRALLSDVKKADALGGARGNSFLQQSVARGMQAAGESGGGAGNMAVMGMGMGMAGGMMGGLQQQGGPQTYQQVPAGGVPTPAPAAPAAAPAGGAGGAGGGEDIAAKLTQLKSLLDQGLITQEDFDAAKAKALGL